MPTIIEENSHQSIPVFCALLAQQGGVVNRMIEMFRVLKREGLGLGEVLRDYASQVVNQMEEVLKISCNTSHSNEKNQVSASIPSVLSNAETILKMIPAAMTRNGTKSFGATKSYALEDVEALYREFKDSPEIQHLLEVSTGWAIIGDVNSSLDQQAAR